MAKFMNLVDLTGLNTFLKEMRDYVTTMVTGFFNGKLLSTQKGTSSASVTGSLRPVSLDKDGKMAVSLPDATQGVSGLLSASDKAKLDGIATGAKTGTVTKVSTGAGLTGGDITTIGTVKLNLVSETKNGSAAGSAAGSTDGNDQLAPVVLDANSKVAALVARFKGSTSLAQGSPGLVPAPGVSDRSKFLKGDGTWDTVVSDLTQMTGYSDLLTTIDQKISTAKTDVETDVDSKISTVYKVKGSVETVAPTGSEGGEGVQWIGLPTKAKLGFVYNVSNAFETTSQFVEGSGKSYPAGTNVVCVEGGSGQYRWDVLAGSIDLTAYQKSEDISVATDAAVKALFLTQQAYSDSGSGAAGGSDLATDDLASLASSKNISTLVTVNALAGEAALGIAVD